MALFGRNANEQNFVGGKKHWTDVIKNRGDGRLLIYKQPEEDFNTNSTVIVMPGEQAIFIKDGTIEQVFDNGKYTLSTENYPFISRLRNAFSGGVSTFNCVVYFVRKADSEEILWGTQTPIHVRDHVWGIMTDARVRGAYKVRITNPAKLLEKLIGNNVFYQTQPELNKYFANEFQSKIKAAVSRFMNDLKQELIGLDAYIDELGDQIEPKIDAIVADYGLKCVRFSIAGLDIDTAKYDRIDQGQIGALDKQREAQGDKARMDILGQDWAKQQAANIMGSLADNPGAGGIGAMGAGMGMGMAAGNAMGNMANELFTPVSGQAEPAKPEAKPAAKPAEDPFETLSKLKKMLDADLISQEQYDAKANEILSQM
ncbi:SPFH domain-containing protein [Lacticaseibacillus baoqingensis]|uniref:SPFH domain-containing protein n=1 Tax=Lacticaseibacillus baoqingensis TaxID=2486013 RepID=A0ABW4E812_9LACO|nr:SPFH domain-containing protein [Lacticaseibacillus baoqingensis]